MSRISVNNSIFLYSFVLFFIPEILAITIQLDRWEVYLENNHGKYYIDVWSLPDGGNRVINNEIVRVWNKLIVSEKYKLKILSQESNCERREKLEHLNNILTYFRIDMNTNEYETLQQIYYSDNGEVLEDISYVPRKNNIPPDTVIEALVNHIKIRHILNALAD